MARSAIGTRQNIFLGKPDVVLMKSIKMTKGDENLLFLSMVHIIVFYPKRYFVISKDRQIETSKSDTG